MNSIYEFNARNVENENKQKKMMAQRCANKFCGRRKLFAKRNLTISMHLFFRNLTPTTQKDSFDYIFIVTNHPKCEHIICIITRLIFCKLFCLVFFRLLTHTHTRKHLNYNFCSFQLSKTKKKKMKKKSATKKQHHHKLQ